MQEEYWKAGNSVANSQTHEKKLQKASIAGESIANYFCNCSRETFVDLVVGRRSIQETDTAKWRIVTLCLI